ncbi:MAG: protein kinase, partial [Actinomycetota bacterium]|nr:protein kinase [Actinomycetota bacterium]
RVVSRIARGALTDLWRAEDEVLGRTVAAKILRQELVSDPSIARRFRVAAMAAARLTHPHIVAVLDTGEHRGLPFIVMEHMPGGTLRERLKNHGAQPARAAEWGAEMAAALKHAHQAGIVHCDIRPENILFTETDHLKVSDFAIARAAWGATRLGREAEGLDAYQAPELKDGRQPDALTDLYSLGIVLYECVTGRVPAPVVMGNGQEGSGQDATRIRSPRELGIDIPPDLDTVIMKALAVRPEDRLDSASAVEKSLRRIASARERTAVAPHIRKAPSRSRRPAGPNPYSFIRTESRWLIPAILIVLAAAALVLAIPSLRERVTEAVAGPRDRGPSPLVIASGQAYDPQGDGEENDSEVPLAFDGDTNTWWSTSSYRNPALGGLKEGVGLILDLGSPKRVESVRVQSVVGGWQGMIRFSNDGRNFSPSGQAVTAQVDETFETEGTHRYLLLWITSLVNTPGEGTANNPYSVAITEITPLGS